MTPRTVLWKDFAESRLLRLPPSDAEDVLRAVEALAERDVGFVRRMIPSGELRLYTRIHVVTFVANQDAIIILAVASR